MGTVAVVVVLVAFAAARLTRLIVLDDLLEPWWRTRFFERFPQTPPGEEPRWRNKLGDLISCPWCTGFWVSGTTLGLAHLVNLATWPLRWDLLIWWAIAGLQGLINGLMEHFS